MSNEKKIAEVQRVLSTAILSMKDIDDAAVMVALLRVASRALLRAGKKLPDMLELMTQAFKEAEVIYDQHIKADPANAPPWYKERG